MNSEKILDFRGEPCPGPLIRTIRTISSMKKGEVLVVLTDIEECMKSIRDSVELLEPANIEVSRESGYWKIIIKL
ncbi:MAG: sulfurtransferase TusA family protein [Thermoprotei archaeon]